MELANIHGIAAPEEEDRAAVVEVRSAVSSGTGRRTPSVGTGVGRRTPLAPAPPAGPGVAVPPPAAFEFSGRHVEVSECIFFVGENELFALKAHLFANENAFEEEKDELVLRGRQYVSLKVIPVGYRKLPRLPRR